MEVLLPPPVISPDIPKALKSNLHAIPEQSSVVLVVIASTALQRDSKTEAIRCASAGDSAFGLNSSDLAPRFSNDDYSQHGAA